MALHAVCMLKVFEEWLRRIAPNWEKWSFVDRDSTDWHRLLPFSILIF